MTRLLKERERKAVRQLVRPVVEMVALPHAILPVLAVLVWVGAYFFGQPAMEIAQNFYLQAAGLVLFYQASLLLAVGVIFAWRFVTERHRIAAYLRQATDRLDLTVSRWAWRWSRILRGVWFPVRFQTPPVLRLVWRDRVAIIGSRFVAGDTPKLE